MFAASLGARAPVHLSGTDVRISRLQAEHYQLAQATSNFVAAHPRLFPLGDDPLVQQFVSAAGFTEFDAVVVRIGMAGRIVTAICVPTRLWRDDEVRRLLHDVKHEAARVGTRCLLIPQRWLKAGVRASVARTLARSRHVRYSRRELDAVIDHLREVRICTLVETANVLLVHDDPIGALLSMACQGLIEIDRSAPLCASTWTCGRL